MSCWFTLITKVHEILSSIVICNNNTANFIHEFVEKTFQLIISINYVSFMLCVVEKIFRISILHS
jgi:hypothetical protein